VVAKSFASFSKKVSPEKNRPRIVGVFILISAVAVESFGLRNVKTFFFQLLVPDVLILRKIWSVLESFEKNRFRLRIPSFWSW